MRSRFLLAIGVMLWACAACSTSDNKAGPESDGTTLDVQADGTVPGQDATLDGVPQTDTKPGDGSLSDLLTDSVEPDAAKPDVVEDLAGDGKDQQSDPDTDVGDDMCGEIKCTSEQECCNLAGVETCVPAGQCVTTEECQADTDCPDGKKCCKADSGNTCKASCGGSSFSCTSDDECDGGAKCCDFFGQMKMCMPESMCPGEPGGCTKDDDCPAGQVCCMFGEMAATPTCMAEAMCPKNCSANTDCPSGQECCDLESQKVCIDMGQCPDKCLYNADCPLGQQCCDAGDGLLICVNSAECPQPVACSQGSVCTNSDGEPNGFQCCEVPTVGWACVGEGGCGTWETCSVNTDCPKGRECCPTMDGSKCLPLSSCLDAEDYKECSAHADCEPTGQMCCIVPDLGKVCAAQADCPSQCLTNSDCSESQECCILPDSPSACMEPGQCSMGQACTQTTDCGSGQECCDMMGNLICVPEGQCMGGGCTVDTDCPSGQKCCDMMGQKMCLAECFF